MKLEIEGRPVFYQTMPNRLDDGVTLLSEKKSLIQPYETDRHGAPPNAQERQALARIFACMENIEIAHDVRFAQDIFLSRAVSGIRVPAGRNLVIGRDVLAKDSGLENEDFRNLLRFAAAELKQGAGRTVCFINAHCEIPAYIASLAALRAEIPGRYAFLEQRIGAPEKAVARLRALAEQAFAALRPLEHKTGLFTPCIPELLGYLRADPYIYSVTPPVSKAHPAFAELFDQCGFASDAQWKSFRHHLRTAGSMPETYPQTFHDGIVMMTSWRLDQMRRICPPSTRASEHFSEKIQMFLESFMKASVHLADDAAAAGAESVERYRETLSRMRRLRQRADGVMLPNSCLIGPEILPIGMPSIDARIERARRIHIRLGMGSAHEDAVRSVDGEMGALNITSRAKKAAGR